MTCEWFAPFLYDHTSNDNGAVFDRALYVATVAMNATIGKHVLTVHSFDRDATARQADIRYRLTNTAFVPTGNDRQSATSDVDGRFVVDRTNGDVAVHGRLDNNRDGYFIVSVEAVDGEPNVDNMTSVNVERAKIKALSVTVDTITVV